jgi:hypothetical protein
MVSKGNKIVNQSILQQIIHDIGLPDNLARKATVKYCSKVIDDQEVNESSIYLIANSFYDGFLFCENFKAK